MPVKLAKKAGFCSGVQKAIDQLLKQAAEQGSGSTLGPLVHNEDVVKYLEKHSIAAVEYPSDTQGAFLAIRTHGITPTELKMINESNIFSVIDLTCTRVKKVQKIAGELNTAGYNIIIFGDREHPEVKGLIGWAGGKACVVSSLEEYNQLPKNQPSALIAQTTADYNVYIKVKEKFVENNPRDLAYDTLCPEARLRQKEAVELAKSVEALVVVGSESSANTKALYDLCRQIKPTCRILNAGELEQSFIESFSLFGVTAGASTPPWTIKEVVEKVEKESVDLEQTEQFNFDEEIKTAQPGEQILGKVARVTDDEVYVDIGAKTEAILPASEVHIDQGKSLTDLFVPEDEVEVLVIDVDEQEGKIIVSNRRFAKEQRLIKLEQFFEEGTVVEGEVKQVMNAGIVINLDSGIDGFMPGSLVDIKYIPDFKEFIGQKLLFKIQEFDREKEKFILSRKAVLEDKAATIKEEVLNKIEVGSVIDGSVKRLTGFGAFVDVGGIDGLVHISELSWDRVEHPGEILQVGDQVKVKVLEVDPNKERISLSLRKTQPDPRVKEIESYQIGQVIQGKVTRLTNFGAFIELQPGIEGLAHISQLAEYHVDHPSEILREGEDVEVKIIEVKPKTKRISLSLKETRGVMGVSVKNNSNDSAASSVTLGDIFGDLFEKEGFSTTGPVESNSEELTDDNSKNDKGGKD